MRKLLIGLLLAATAASPALADKGGHGHGGGNHGGGGHGGPHGSGNPHWGGGGNPHSGGGNDHGGGWKHAAPAMSFAAPAFRGNRGGHGPQVARGWARPAPFRAARFDDKQARKAWKHEAQDQRKFARAWERQERFRPAKRIVRVERYVPPRIVRYAPPRVVRYVEPPVRYVQPRVVRYVAPPPVRYVAPIRYAPVYAQPNAGYWPRQYDYDDYAPAYPATYYRPAAYYGAADYWPESYSPIDPAYRAGSGGLFGSSGNGLLGALLPIVLQSVIGGNIGGLGTYGSLGGLTSLYSPDVLPLQDASYAPYANELGNTDLASLLLPSLLGSGSIF